jgi:hypothetical protein
MINYGLGKEEEVWKRCVVDPSVATVSAFLSKDDADRSDRQPCTDEKEHNDVSRDLWTRFICEVSNCVSSKSIMEKSINFVILNFVFVCASIGTGM